MVLASIRYQVRHDRIDKACDRRPGSLETGQWLGR